MSDVTSERFQRLRDGFDLVTKHFAVLSVLAAVMGAVLAIIFIAAYLRVFDWRIIWIIEYSDILKVGLIAVALLSAFSFWIWTSAAQAIDFANQKGRVRIVSITFGLALWCISLALFLYGDYHSAEPVYALHLWMHVAILAVLGLVLVPMQAVRNFQRLDAARLVLVVFIVVANVASLGTAFGYYTRDTEGFHHDVFLKSEEFRNVGVVMLTSHHVVLYKKDGTVIVVPTTDVLKLERRKAK